MFVCRSKVIKRYCDPFIKCAINQNYYYKFFKINRRHYGEGGKGTNFVI